MIELEAGMRALAQLAQHVAQEVQVVAQRGRPAEGHAKRAAQVDDAAHTSLCQIRRCPLECVSAHEQPLPCRNGRASARGMLGRRAGSKGGSVRAQRAPAQLARDLAEGHAVGGVREAAEAHHTDAGARAGRVEAAAQVAQRALHQLRAGAGTCGGCVHAAATVLRALLRTLF